MFIYSLAPSSAPMILTSYAVDSSTAILQWAAPPPEDHNGVIQDYVINITALNTGAYREMTFIGTTVVIVSLIPSFTYHFSVSARTVGIGPYSDPVTITMPQDGKTLTANHTIRSTIYSLINKSLFFVQPQQDFLAM